MTPEVPPKPVPDSPQPSGRSAGHTSWLVASPLLLVLAWCYGEGLWELAKIWVTQADYNHCVFVPVFSGYLLWFRRKSMPSIAVQPSRLAMYMGGGLILSAGALCWIGIYLQFRLLEPFSILPVVVGVTLLLGGWPALKWAWPSILFLGFMIPLPGFIAGALSLQLQRVATICSTFVLQTCGIPAVAVGNVIRLSDGEIGVVEACSGLRMLNVFFAITLGAAFVIERPRIDKFLIVMSAGVIGILANIIRISVTGMAYEWVSGDLADKIFHDLAGWLMMPLALLLLAFELWLLSHLVVATRSDEPVMLR